MVKINPNIHKIKLGNVGFCYHFVTHKMRSPVNTILTGLSFVAGTGLEPATFGL